MSETRALAAIWTKKLNIRALRSDSRVVELSGGNQQKVVIAKALVQRPRLIIFDEPTRGVDVGAIAEIHHLLGALADEGLAVIVLSAGNPELVRPKPCFETGPHRRRAFARRGDIRIGNVRSCVLVTNSESR